ncbi:MAG TPA: DUF4337 domain-containing protein [Bryobacteraceae bacterium]|nr:DUF4337 domain-containing protein [Bryobacteraceae bacterium]
MTELEIHHESGHAIDPTGQKVGVLAALLAVFLAVVTIASHRTHTAAIIFKSDANDQWALYQAIRVKYHSLELGENLAAILNANGDAADKMLADYANQKKKYDDQGKESQEKARTDGEMAEAAEHRALRYDIGEGLLEIGLVLTSLYFISKKMMFPVLGLAAGLGGVVIAATGMMM